MICESSTFEGGEQVLDGNEYKACEFRNCRIVYRGGPCPSMVQCHFADCEWVFEDAADRTVGFLRSLYHGMGPAGKKLVEDTFDAIRKP